MIKGAVFDMDGLMMDTERIVFENWREIMAECGYRYDLETFKKTIGVRRVETERMMKGIYGDDFPYLDIAEKCHVLFIEKTERDGIPVKKGLFELLGYLKENGIKMAVATSTRRGSATRALSITGVLDYFDAVVCGEDVQNGKPDPEVFLTAAQRIDTPAGECIALEDSINGIIAAHRAGMLTVMIPDMIEPTEGLAPLPDHLFGDLSEVVGMISAINS